MNTYGIEVGQTRRSVEGVEVYIHRIHPSGNAVIERLKDKAKTEMDCFKISYRYCEIVINDEE